ncbi:MAG: SMI1/KNR4 family protein [Planctomycetota bacterium]
MHYRIKLAFDVFNSRTQKFNKRALAQIRPWLAGIAPDQVGDDDPEVAGIEFTLGEENVGPTAKTLRQVDQGKLPPLGDVRIYERLDDAELKKAKWFVFRPRTDLREDNRRRHGLHTVNGARVKPGPPTRVCPNISFNSVYFSESAWSRVQELGWRGLDAAWMSDSGKYRAPEQWFHVWATKPLARGYDHPWFDVRTIGERVVRWHSIAQTDDPTWRYGIDEFAINQIRKDVSTGWPAFDKLLKTLRKNVGSIESPGCRKVWGLRRVPRQGLPRVDFAYLWVMPIERMASHGYHFDPYRLCTTAKVRRAMLKQGMAQPDDFEPILVLDEAPPGSEALDERSEALPEPLFHGEWLEKLRAEEAKARAKFEANPKPDKPTDFKPVMTRLKRRAKKEKWPAGASATAITAAEKKLKRPVPAGWAGLLKAADGFEFDEAGFGEGQALRVAAAAQLAKEHRSNASMAKLSWPELPKAWLGAASTDNGDPIFLDTSAVTAAGDCPVIWFDHETGSETARWPSIAAFLSEALDRASV